MGGGTKSLDELTELPVTSNYGLDDTPDQYYKFYMIKIKQGLLFSDRIMLNYPANLLNFYNIYKGKNWRCPSVEEYTYVLNTDLDGNIIKGSLTTDNTLTQNMKNYSTNFFHDCGVFDKTFVKYGFGFALYRPIYEYVDNSKSTNIFY